MPITSDPLALCAYNSGELKRHLYGFWGYKKFKAVILTYKVMTLVSLPNDKWELTLNKATEIW